MYGRIFESLFTGSMVGQGPLMFAVWAYVLAHVRDGLVELNPTILAAVIGAPNADIADTIRRLCKPDPDSRSQEEEGRRLLHLQAYAYEVVNAKKYRKIASEADRRASQREWARKHRQELKEAEGSESTSVDTASTSVDKRRQAVDLSEAEADTEAEGTDLSKPAAFDASVLNSIAENWNGFAKSWRLPTVRTPLSQKRRDFIRVRWLQWAEQGDPWTIFNQCLDAIARSPHCKGDNDRGWRVSLNSLFERRDFWEKLLEGQYAGKEQNRRESLDRQVADYFAKKGGQDNAGSDQQPD